MSAISEEVGHAPCPTRVMLPNMTEGRDYLT